MGTGHSAAERASDAAMTPAVRPEAELGGAAGSGPTMRAVGIRRYGPPEALTELEVERPHPAPAHVLVRVAAAGVNPADCLLRSGRLRFAARQKMPFVPGADVAGLVEEVGADVTRFRVGDPVYAMLPNTAGGGYAEYAVAAEDTVALVPSSLTLSEAAGVPLAALTALQALRDQANLTAGDHLLVNGASGGVGTFAVQIAQAIGATVTAVTSGRNTEVARELGADEVLDYTRDDITDGGARYDVVLDGANVLPFRKARRILKTDGVFVTVNPILGRLSPSWLARFRDGKRIRSVLVEPDGTDLEALGTWIASGKLRPVIERTYPLSDAEIAHRRSESRRVRGKLVLVVNADLAHSTPATAPLHNIATDVEP
ncbi:MAG TPA: NAD(P)-dependent alcohol dehydrogenase [Pseudonocardiaceae bacterium]|nr:NAD(P)-dependent alcohol dehydrogenase [Pseudonocardiaceae bacterium]